MLNEDKKQPVQRVLISEFDITNTGEITDIERGLKKQSPIHYIPFYTCKYFSRNYYKRLHFRCYFVIWKAPWNNFIVYIFSSSKLIQRKYIFETTCNFYLSSSGFGFLQDRNLKNFLVSVVEARNPSPSSQANHHMWLCILITAKEIGRFEEGAVKVSFMAVSLNWRQWSK